MVLTKLSEHVEKYRASSSFARRRFSGESEDASSERRSSLRSNTSRKDGKSSPAASSQVVSANAGAEKKRKASKKNDDADEDEDDDGEEEAAAEAPESKKAAPKRKKSVKDKNPDGNDADEDDEATEPPKSKKVTPKPKKAVKAKKPDGDDDGEDGEAHVALSAKYRPWNSPAPFGGPIMEPNPDPTAYGVISHSEKDKEGNTLPLPDFSGQPPARNSNAQTAPQELWEDRRIGFRFHAGDRHTTRGEVYPRRKREAALDEYADTVKGLLEDEINDPDEPVDQNEYLIIKLIDMRKGANKQPKRQPIYWAHKNGVPKDWSDKDMVKRLNDSYRDNVKSITVDAVWSQKEAHAIAECLRKNKDVSIKEVAWRLNDKFMGEDVFATPEKWDEKFRGRTIESVRAEYLAHKRLYDQGLEPRKDETRNKKYKLADGKTVGDVMREEAQRIAKEEAAKEEAAKEEAAKKAADRKKKKDKGKGKEKETADDDEEEEGEREREGEEVEKNTAEDIEEDVERALEEKAATMVFAKGANAGKPKYINTLTPLEVKQLAQLRGIPISDKDGKTLTKEILVKALLEDDHANNITYQQTATLAAANDAGVGPSKKTTKKNTKKKTPAAEIEQPAQNTPRKRSSTGSTGPSSPSKRHKFSASATSASPSESSIRQSSSVRKTAKVHFADGHASRQSSTASTGSCRSSRRKNSTEGRNSTSASDLFKREADAIIAHHTAHEDDASLDVDED
ncbi:hypothetical protein BU23DRAFT_596324 [Bimuria novae-zelandiae CBS 107.79]|uniref:Uncharacterized protein n=1 Tax=Bimuria novae-zelandiae CBS 107.79 TaxID=1447943 RepID=A0A6A5VNW8_9PLEO|nr:hypothetical protein BU23DRAFT_596324 [Bimuria novae-zelandiae CBS 107.79]